MTELPISHWLRNLENSWLTAHNCLASLAPSPKTASWKNGLKACWDSGNDLRDQQQTQAYWEQWSAHIDLPSFIDYCQQLSEIDQALRSEWLNWQLKGPKLLQQQWFVFLHRCLNLRSGADGLLALNALQESTGQLRKEQLESLQQLCSGISPALQSCFEQYLQSAPTPDH
ncbi:MAG: hypothetical protein RL571_1237 [Pseudomonadota bacterium]|jgi:hypothetical protein